MGDLAASQLQESLDGQSTGKRHIQTDRVIWTLISEDLCSLNLSIVRILTLPEIL